MSIHPSLTAAKGKKQRSVLKRYERIEKLKKESKWKEDTSSFGLPKVKVIKMKLKKVKSTEAKADAGKAGEVAPSKTASK
ncbi:MAG: small basic protein [Candidatus Omnitrophica bacterium]|nr:small basic protein [Candidatus Omnitrophota bacterium]